MISISIYFKSMELANIVAEDLLNKKLIIKAAIYEAYLKELNDNKIENGYGYRLEVLSFKKNFNKVKELVRENVHNAEIYYVDINEDNSNKPVLV